MAFCGFPQAGGVFAKIRAAPVLLSRKVERNFTLGASDYADQFSLRLVLVASHALPHGNLFRFLFHRAGEGLFPVLRVVTFCLDVNLASGQARRESCVLSFLTDCQ